MKPSRLENSSFITLLYAGSENADFSELQITRIPFPPPCTYLSLLHIFQRTHITQELFDSLIRNASRKGL